MTTVTDKIRAHFRKYPTANVKETAQKFNQPLSRIYKLRKEVGEENMSAAQIPPDLVPVPMPVPVPLLMPKNEAKAANTSTVDKTLNERAKEYGKFKDGAALMQGMKRLLSDHAAQHGQTFYDDQWEALEMIVHKIGRIVNGNPDKVDHWVDIAGYATLVADRLQGVER